MPAPRPARPVLAALPTLLAVALLAVAARWFALRWDAVMAGDARPPVAFAWLVPAALLLGLHAASSVILWRSVLRAVGVTLSGREAVDSFVPSLLARYVPGKIWASAVRLELARRAGARLGAGAGAILWETLIALGSAGLVALVGLREAGRPEAVRAAALLAAGAAMVWVATAMLSRHPRGAAVLHRIGGTEPVRAPAALAPAVGAVLMCWALFAFAHLAIVRAVAPVGLESLPLVAGAVTLAWAGGYLAVVMPMGLGVRDGLLLVLLAPLLDPPGALLFVALSRLVQLAVDGGITAGWLLQRSLRRPAGARPPSA
jgi:glycosyltransferase 2 family protein